MESRKRTLVKAVVWNLIGLMMMAIVGLIATGSWALGGGMAMVNSALGLSMYIVYERLWSRVRWGRNV